MGLILSLLALVVGIASLVFWIWTLVVFFKRSQILIGILGIICPIVAFVMGWVKADEYNHKQIMIYWSVCLVLGIILNVLTNVVMASS